MADDKTEDKTPDVTPDLEQSTAGLDPALEAEARDMGWRPKEEFRGDESKWVDAETFVTRGREVLPLVKAQNKRLQQELNEIKATVREFKNHHETVRQRAFDDAMATLKTMQADAVTRGDGEAFAKIEDEKLKMMREAQQASRQSEGPDPGFVAWTQKNPWYGSDAEMTRMADTLGAGLRAQNPNADGNDILAAVEVDIRRHFPHRFSQKKPVPAVDGVGRPQDRPGAKSYQALPPEAKAACDRFVKQGLLTKEQYVKEFFGEA